MAFMGVGSIYDLVLYIYVFLHSLIRLLTFVLSSLKAFFSSSSSMFSATFANNNNNFIYSPKIPQQFSGQHNIET